MFLLNMNHNELQMLLTQLDQALYNHQQWYSDLVRTFVCRLPFDNHNLLPEAHKECRFGQWYYNSPPSKINEHPGFVAIGKAHEEMHNRVKTVLNALSKDNTITPQQYDDFSNSLERFRLEMEGLKSELESLLNYRDPLTMAINRINLFPTLREQQELMKRQKQTCCVAMLDLDHFKKINDKYGHIIGDKVLVAIAHYFIENIRPYDKLFRYGGEEFLICMPQTDLDHAYKVIDRLRTGIERLPINVGLESAIFITVSFGVAILELNSSIEDSIDHADKALYEAKAAGRNCTKIYSEPKK